MTASYINWGSCRVAILVPPKVSPHLHCYFPLEMTNVAWIFCNDTRALVQVSFLLKIKVTLTFLNPVHWSQWLFQIFQHNVVQIWTLQKRIKWCLTYFGKKISLPVESSNFSWTGRAWGAVTVVPSLEEHLCPQYPSDNSVLPAAVQLPPGNY